jgi:diaminohydroxyphosphoribosylaminopyrimidine deaminase/5-amino-6-(5-phosphoribosylamino)uracil reductase
LKTISDIHEKYMRRALQLARKGVGKTSPNPAVGCVIVKNGEVVGEGWHRKAGTPHAEVHALRAAGERAKGADLYVTLEPCSHHGKTPPCADAVIASKVARVFAGMVDPNPKVSGKGVARLKNAGIKVSSGLMEQECRCLNEPFIKHITTGIPFVTLKSAMTLDGMIASASGDSRWVTGEVARRHVHRLRSQSDAIMVGAGTVLVDDPLLTARIPGGQNPLRVVVDSRLRIPLTAQLLNSPTQAVTLIATLEGSPAARELLGKPGVELLLCKEKVGEVDLLDLLHQLGGRGVQSLLLEGGATLSGAFLRAGLVDKLILFYAPRILGGGGIPLLAGPGAARMADAIPVRDVTVHRFGEDICISGYPEGPCSPV